MFLYLLKSSSAHMFLSVGYESEGKMALPAPAFREVPIERLIAWIKLSLEHPLEFGKDINTMWGVVQENEGSPTFDVWGYLAYGAGYTGHVAMPLAGESIKLWEKAGYGELERRDWDVYTNAYIQCRTKQEWLDVCKLWFGSKAVEGALADEQ